MKQPSAYAKYNALEDAAFLIDLLQRNNIPYEITHEVNQLDTVFLGDPLDQLYVVNIQPSDFMAVNNILAAQARQDFDGVGFTHYFDQFEEHELLEVGDSPNEWSAYDVEIARLMINKKYKTEFKEATALDYSSAFKPETISTKWLILNYVLSISMLGIFIGASITSNKKTLPNGSTVYVYDEKSRTHGGIMIIMGALMSFIYFARILISSS